MLPYGVLQSLRILVLDLVVFNPNATKRIIIILITFYSYTYKMSIWTRGFFKNRIYMFLFVFYVLVLFFIYSPTIICKNNIAYPYDNNIFFIYFLSHLFFLFFQKLFSKVACLGFPCVVSYRGKNSKHRD